MQKIKDEIKDRALQEYPEKFKGNLYNYVDCNSISRGCYKQGAESMIPVMQDVAVKFAAFQIKQLKQTMLGEITILSNPISDSDLFTHFINEVYGKD